MKTRGAGGSGGSRAHAEKRNVSAPAARCKRTHPVSACCKHGLHAIELRLRSIERTNFEQRREERVVTAGCEFPGGSARIVQSAGDEDAHRLQGKPGSRPLFERETRLAPGPCGFGLRRGSECQHEADFFKLAAIRRQNFTAETKFVMIDVRQSGNRRTA